MKRIITLIMLLAFVFTINAAYLINAKALDYSVIRVKLSTGSVSTVSFTPSGNYVVASPIVGLYSGQKYTVKIEGGALSLYLGTSRLFSGKSLITVEQRTPPAGKTNTLELYNSAYKQNLDYLGDMVFRQNGSSIDVINSVYLEKYLYGVVPHEMSNTWPLEALKAQAITARTYAANSIGSGNYDVGDTSSNQVYKGYDASDTQAIKAVDDTARQVLQYGGKLVLAYFAASNGGQTELPQHIWSEGRALQPYQGLFDDPYDVKNPYSPWERLYFPVSISGSGKILYTKQSDGRSTSAVASTKAEAYLKLLAYNSFSAADKATYGLKSKDDIVLKGVTAMSANTLENSQHNTYMACRDYIKAPTTVLVQVTRAATAAEKASTGNSTITANVSKAVTIDMRELDGSYSQYNNAYKAFSNTSLQLFVVEPVKSGATVTGYAIYQRRYGHGVGLSQRGAQQRAKDGQSYIQILDFYFPKCDKSGGHYTQLSISDPAVNTKAIPKYTVSVSSSNSAYGKVSGGGVASSGSNITLKATQSGGYYFAGWMEDLKKVSGSSTYTFPVTQNHALTAQFAKIGTPAASAASSGYNSVRVSWTAAAGATGYDVFRASSLNGTYTKIKSINALSATDTGLKTGTSYFYKVRAYYSGASVSYGAFSPVVSAKPVPASPAAKVSTASYNSLKISWGKVSGATKYELYRASSKTGSYKSVTATTSASYTNSSLTSGSAYFYKVRAYHLEGKTKVYGAYSGVVSGVPIPAAPSVKASSASYSSAKISWGKVSGATKYELYRASSKTGAYSLVKTLSGTNYTNGGLSSGSTYYYKVRAYHMQGSKKVTGAFSAAVSARPIPAAPKTVKAKKSGSSITVSFEKVSGASKYQIYRATSKKGAYTCVATVSSASLKQKSLKKGTYYYKVRAYRIQGGATVYGSFSGTVSARIS